MRDSIDHELLFSKVVDILAEKGISVNVSDVRIIFHNRCEMLDKAARNLKTIKFGKIGKFTVFKGRKDALDYVKILKENGFTDEEIRAKCKEKMANAKVNYNTKSGRLKDTSVYQSNEIDELFI